MIMIANLQYAWTLFVKPLQDANGWKLSDVQWAFTLFVLPVIYTFLARKRGEELPSPAALPQPAE